MRMLCTKPMSQIFEIHFHMPANKDANQGVLMWYAFFVKAVTIGYERPVCDNSLHKPSLVKLCIIVFNSSTIKKKSLLTT